MSYLLSRSLHMVSNVLNPTHFQRRFCVLFCFVIGSNLLFCQDYLSLKTVKSSLKSKYDKALKLYQLNKYSEAQNSFEKIIRKEPNFIDAYLILASLHFDQHHFTEAEYNFQKVIELNNEYNPKVYYTYSLANYNNRHYDLAYANIQKFIQLEKSNNDLLEKARIKMITFRFADSAVRHPVAFNPIPVSTINSDFSEYLPSLTADGKTMVFTRKIFNDQEDLFVSYKSEDGKWSTPESLDEINTPLNEGAPSISADGNTLVFVCCDRREGLGGCDLYISKKKNNKWGPAVNMGEKVNTPAYESQPCISDNGNMLIFCSNRVGSIGKKDLWITVKSKSNGWIKPINLGPVINTAMDEECPFLHQDGKTLYFSSNGHPGIGQKDIFYSKLIATNQWSTPTNLGYPLNSPLDESSFVAYFDGSKAMMASDRSFQYTTDPNTLKNINLDIFEFDIPETDRPVSSCYLDLVVLDSKTETPLQAQIDLFQIATNKNFLSEQLNTSGRKLVSIPGHNEYAINISYPNYHLISDQFICNSNTAFHPERKIWKMTEIDNKPVILKNIFFTTNSANIKEESFFELDHLVQLLQLHSQNDVMIIGHTDNVGSDADNEVLSAKRASAVADYLVSKGINRQRISSVGMGEKKPIADNNSEAGRELNRRTEFILKNKS